MADIPFHAIDVNLVVRRERSDEGCPLPFEGLPSPILGLMFLITRHLNHPPSGYASRKFSGKFFMMLRITSNLFFVAILFL